MGARETYIEQLPPGLEPEILVNGQEWRPTVTQCTHVASHLTEAVVAVSETDAGRTRWQIKLRLKCAECGVDFRFPDAPEGMLRQDGTAVVFELRPGEIDDAG